MNPDILQDTSISTVSIQVTDYLHWLYTNEQKAFRELYTKAEQEKRYLLPLLASIRLYNQEKFDLTPIKNEVIEYLREERLPNNFKKGFDIINAIQQGQTPFSESVFEEPTIYSLHSYTFNYTDLGLLYDYDEDCKKYIEFLFQNALYNDCYHDYRNLLGNLLTVQVQCYRKTAYEIIDHLFDKKLLNTRMLFYVFACHLFFGEDNIYLDSQVVKPYIQQYPKEALELIAELTDKDYEIARKWIVLVYEITGLDDFSPLLPYLKHKEISIRNLVDKILYENEEKAIPFIRQYLEMEEKPNPVLQDIIIRCHDKMYETPGYFKSEQEVIDFCKQQIDLKQIKNQSWIPEKTFKGVRFKNGKIVPPVVLQFFLQCYMSLKEPARIHLGERITEWLEPEKFTTFLTNLYNRWIKEDANPKYKTITLPFALFGDNESLSILSEQVVDLMHNSRSAVATFIIKAIGLNGSEEATKRVGYFAIYKEWTGAILSLRQIAEDRQISVYYLEDEIIPTLGFTEKGTTSITYPDFTLTVQLMPDFTFSFSDGDKLVASYTKLVPSDYKNDIKGEISTLKKQLKEVVKEQESRLIEILMNGRKWAYSKWLEVFTEHPVVYHFARQLIWGVYEKDKPVTLFTINTQKQPQSLTGESIRIAKDSAITLVHPIECREIQGWYKNHPVLPYLENLYHILTLPIPSPLAKEEIENKKIKRYQMQRVSKEVDLIRIVDRRYKTGVIFWDTYGIYFRDKYQNIEGLLKTSGINHSYKDTILIDLRFYPYLLRRDYDFEQIKETHFLNPENIPERYLYTVLMLCEDFKNQQ